jgi:hypothetical protein
MAASGRRGGPRVGPGTPSGRRGTSSRWRPWRTPAAASTLVPLAGWRERPDDESAALVVALLQQLEVRVSLAGVVGRQDVVHHTLEGPAAPP